MHDSGHPTQKKLSVTGVPGDGGEEQLIAANIDAIFIVTSIGKDLNLRRLERYLTVFIHPKQKR